MSLLYATKSEHESELQAKIEQCEKEIAKLEEEKEKLKEVIASESSKMRADPLLSCFPVLDYCKRSPKNPVYKIPVEQVSNTLVQFELAQKAIMEHNHADENEISRLHSALREEEKCTVQWEAKKKKLADQSGIDLKFLDKKGEAALHVMDKAASSMSITELEDQHKVVTKELKMGNSLLAKKGNAIKLLTKQVEERMEIIDVIDELYNGIRVADRDAKVEDEAIDRLERDIEEVNKELSEKAEAAIPAIRSVILQDAAEVRNDKLDIINTVKEPQERLMKAQEYRIEQLEKRLSAVDVALQNNHLKKDVEEQLEQNWDGETLQVPNTRSKEEYGIESIIPSQEKVHPGLHNLFLSEKERVTRVVSVLNLNVNEKDEVISSLTCQAEALARNFSATLEELHELASSAAYAEEKQSKEALVHVREQYEMLQVLKNERGKLENKVRRQLLHPKQKKKTKVAVKC